MLMMMLIPGIKSKIIIMIVLYFDMIFCCHCHCVILVILYILRYGYEYKKYFFNTIIHILVLLLM